MIYKYREPKKNEQFVISADPAEGGDNSTFVVLSKNNTDVVMVGKSKEESSQLGYTLDRVGRWFYSKTAIYPTIAVERNVGAATIYVLKTLNYPELFRMPDSFTNSSMEDTEQFGWSTNISTRPKMLDDLALAVRQRAITIPSKHIIDELFTFIRHEKTGKPQSDRGSHDDLVMALAIAWQLYQIVNPKVSDDLEWELLAEQNERLIKERYRW